MILSIPLETPKNTRFFVQLTRLSSCHNETRLYIRNLPTPLVRRFPWLTSALRRPCFLCRYSLNKKDFDAQPPPLLRFLITSGLPFQLPTCSLLTYPDVSTRMDPFSVAGTAVGITSLGIQVCQALARYYAQFRSFHDDINAVVRRVESLERILRALDSVKNTVQVGDDEALIQFQNAMETARDALGCLQKEANRCGYTTMPDDLRDKAKLVRKRLLWPFKRDTLLGLQRTLDRLQANLILALNVLGISVGQRNLDVLATTSNALMARSELFEHGLNAQSMLLESIHDGVQNLSAAQHAGLDQSVALLLRFAVLERKLDMLVRISFSTVLAYLYV